MLESKQSYLEKIHTNANGSYMLTKCLPKEKPEACRRRAGLGSEAEKEICWVCSCSRLNPS